MPRLYKEDHLPLQKSPETTEEQEVGVRWMPAYEDMSPEAEECLLLEDVVKQCSEDCH
jgi:hypothetical protein